MDSAITGVYKQKGIIAQTDVKVITGLITNINLSA